MGLHEFYIHVDGSGAATSFGPFYLEAFPYCTSSDITPNTDYPNVEFDAL